MDDKLAHFGILGMKWGVRRSKKQLDSSRTKKPREKTDREKANDIKKERKKTSKNRRSLSDEELQTAIGRLETEKKLRTLTEEDVAAGRSPAVDVLAQIGKSSVTAAGTAVATYAIKAALEGRFDRKEAASFIRPKK